MTFIYAVFFSFRKELVAILNVFRKTMKTFLSVISFFWPLTAGSDCLWPSVPDYALRLFQFLPSTSVLPRYPRGPFPTQLASCHSAGAPKEGILGSLGFCPQQGELDVSLLNLRLDRPAQRPLLLHRTVCLVPVNKIHAFVCRFCSVAIEVLRF